MKKVRGFEVVRGKEGDGINLPKRQTKNSAGYDFEAAEDTIIPSIWKSIAKRLIAKVNPFTPDEAKSSYDENVVKPTLVRTGVKAYMQEDEVLQIYPRSSMGIKKGLMLSNTVGIIDSSYYGNPDNDGNIGLALLNTSGKGITIKAGERIAQGIFIKYLRADNDETLHEERTGGFGSSGK